jgi:thymidylate synthase
MNKWSNYGKWRHPEKRKELMKIDVEEFNRKAQHIIDTVVKPQVERYELIKNMDIKNNNLDKQYQSLLQDILDNGVKKETRNGGTLSVFGRQIRHKMKDGFSLLTTKKMAWKSIVTELIWFLRGDTNIKFLVDNNCHIWTGDAYKNYINNPAYKAESVVDLMSSQAGQLVKCSTQEEFVEKIKTDDEFANKWGDLGKIYGKQWRSWGTGENVTIGHNGLHTLVGEKVIDQIANLINDLKTNPDSRRLMVNAWNVGELDQMVLPPCHYGFQVYTRELSLDERTKYRKKRDGIARTFAPYTHQMLDNSNIPTRAISLMFNMRSTDVGLGLSFNLSSYGLLLMMIAKQVNMVPDELIYNGGDVHLYLNHIEPIKEQLNREPYELPTVKISDRVVNDISEYTLDDIILENYQSHPTIKMQLSN